MPSCSGVLWFFFQAEDGIRDIGVTGVQTCALPISLDPVLQLVDVALDLPLHRGLRAPVLGRGRAGRGGHGGEDRKSVVSGKRVDLGGRRILNKKITAERRSPGTQVTYHLAARLFAA